MKPTSVTGFLTVLCFVLLIYTIARFVFGFDVTDTTVLTVTAWVCVTQGWWLGYSVVAVGYGVFACLYGY